LVARATHGSRRGDGRRIILLDAWNNVAFVAGEIASRRRTYLYADPRTAIVTIVYLLINVSI